MRTFDIRWQNFRSFKDTKWLSLKPITVILGANSSGKTSIIAPILLLKQTRESRDSSLSLKTKGRLFNAGSYEDVVYAHDISKEVVLNVRFRKQAPRTQKTGRVGEEAPAMVELAFSAADDRETLCLKSFKVKDVVGRTMLHRQMTDSGTYSLAGFDTRGASREFIEAVKKTKPEGFLFSPDTVFSTYASRLKELSAGGREGAELKVELSKPIQQYIGILGYTAGSIQTLLHETAYIGPIRQRPRRIYEMTGEAPYSVGPEGEYAPEMIFRSNDTTFLAAVNEWVAKFQFGFNLQKDRLKEGVFSITLRRTSDSPKINLADTGFGLSQVLPLIVQGLSAKEGSMIIAEQPEIHLNPRLQSVLADLFCAIAGRGVGVIVETHSEHLLLRLRRKVAEGSLKPDDVALFFVEREDDTSTVRQIPIDDIGHIASTDWPKGFFEDSLTEALALATAQQRSRHAR